MGIKVLGITDFTCKSQSPACCLFLLYYCKTLLLQKLSSLRKSSGFGWNCSDSPWLNLHVYHCHPIYICVCVFSAWRPQSAANQDWSNQDSNWHIITKNEEWSAAVAEASGNAHRTNPGDTDTQQGISQTADKVHRGLSEEALLGTYVTYPATPTLFHNRPMSIICKT